MIDLVNEEERVAHLTGQGFEELLLALDKENPSDLCDRYAELSDRYMVLQYKGQRSAEETLALDRLDSAFSMLLGEAGFLVLAGRLMALEHSAKGCAGVFRLAGVSATALLQTRLELAKMAELIRLDGLRGPIPAEGDRLLFHASRADRAAAALLELHGVGGWWVPLARAGLARRSLNRLFDELGEFQAPNEAWQAAARLLRPDRVSAGEQIRRLKICYRLAGIADCWTIAGSVKEKVRDLAELVREGLGA
ncbi:MAG: hypothetical protein JRF33_01840 [Deltaproteobacteria bacterium]|nr:hypothetical protein [Deltaproteobacteria bacterium]